MAGLLVAISAATGCAARQPAAEAPAAVVAVGTPSASTSQAPRPDCPRLPSHGQNSTMVDYADFVTVGGVQFLTDLDRSRTLRTSDLRAEQLRVRCSFAELNDRTHQNPGPPRDGDAAFLAPGTPVFAIQGWSPRCRLAARHDGAWHVYLAYQDDTKMATPEPCALHH